MMVASVVIVFGTYFPGVISIPVMAADGFSTVFFLWVMDVAAVIALVPWTPVVALAGGCVYIHFGELGIPEVFHYPGAGNTL
jgi:hypothetical protein